MKEQPILFNSEMVKAILEGRKTQTRRVIKPQPDNPNTLPAIYKDGAAYNSNCQWTDDNHYPMPFAKCPYGIPGDRLWVRETIENIPENGNFYYRADKKGVGNRVFDLLINHFTREKKIIPSIHMPRWASRITLEITDIRVDRVQDITPEDSCSEGVSVKFLYRPSDGDYDTAFMDGFSLLWDSINEKRGFGWSVNPWVWVVEFKKEE